MRCDVSTFPPETAARSEAAARHGGEHSLRDSDLDGIEDAGVERQISREEQTKAVDHGARDDRGRRVEVSGVNGAASREIEAGATSGESHRHSNRRPVIERVLERSLASGKLGEPSLDEARGCSLDVIHVREHDVRSVLGDE